MSAIPQFTISELLDAGVHFGHKTRRWNPKMAEYIYGERNGVHIMDLRKTGQHLHQALVQVHDVAKRNGRILFVGTKPQASPIIAEEAKRCGQFYINKRWLGGTMTNWQTISDSIRTLRKYNDLLENPENSQNLKKKELLDISRKLERLENSIGGIKEMGGVPDLIVVIDINKEELALTEAKKLGIPVIAVVDTNCDPENVDLVVPGNDDSIRSIKLYCKLFADAVLAGIEESLVDAPVVQAAPEPAANENAKAEEAKEEKKEEKPKLETVVKKSRKVKKEGEEASEAKEETKTEEK